MKIGVHRFFLTRVFHPLFNPRKQAATDERHLLSFGALPALRPTWICLLVLGNLTFVQAANQHDFEEQWVDGISQDYRLLEDPAEGGGYGRLFLPPPPPPGVFRDKPVKSPLVILAHGNGFHYTQYDYLGRFLAASGFFTAVIDSPDDTTIDERKEQIIEHLDFLYERFGYRLNPELVMIGHSRGGEAVIHASNHLAEQYRGKIALKALVCLAPSGMAPLQTPSVHAAEALLIIHGSHDDDVYGETGFGLIPRSPFSIYDRTWLETSYQGSLTRHKTMIFLHGGSHSGFSEREPDDEEFAPYLEPWQQRLLTREYIGALLRWTFAGELRAAEYLKGMAIPGPVLDMKYMLPNHYGAGQGDSIAFTLQYEPLRKRVIQHFERNRFEEGTTPVIRGNLYYHCGKLYNLEAQSPHQTGGLSIGWNMREGRVPEIRFPIPPGSQNFSTFTHLSFRVAQVHDDWNLPSQNQDFGVSLYTTSSNRTQFLGDWGILPYPAANLPAEKGQADLTKSAMNTVLIPLAAFDGIDLGEVREIALTFGVPRADGLVRGKIVLDSLALIGDK